MNNDKKPTNGRAEFQIPPIKAPEHRRQLPIVTQPEKRPTDNSAPAQKKVTAD